MIIVFLICVTSSYPIFLLFICMISCNSDNIWEPGCIFRKPHNILGCCVHLEEELSIVPGLFTLTFVSTNVQLQNKHLYHVICRKIQLSISMWKTSISGSILSKSPCNFKKKLVSNGKERRCREKRLLL